MCESYVSIGDFSFAYKFSKPVSVTPEKGQDAINFFPIVTFKK